MELGFEWALEPLYGLGSASKLGWENVILHPLAGSI